MITLEDEIILRDIMNNVRKSRVNDEEHRDRYYDFKDRIICTMCYEISLFQPPIKKTLAKYQRIHIDKKTGEHIYFYVCADHCDDLDDGQRDDVFDNMWELEHDGESYDTD